ncbi:hypothetical protein BT96DRAFT_389628 [Gymnopus androsaceus JB14]|uniref:Uncharacterized protein n=1 Tax=Gymnopus androsaceus JB14 TaxID=1447944 RepID=A0A6A4GVE6_9AGAR|nr:hypothetical protein BT96DRAFT_389628 [Gymnopus androsaceus JB14]
MKHLAYLAIFQQVPSRVLKPSVSKVKSWTCRFFPQSSMPGSLFVTLQSHSVLLSSLLVFTMIILNN